MQVRGGSDAQNEIYIFWSTYTANPNTDSGRVLSKGGKKLPKAQRTEGIESLNLSELLKLINKLQNIDQTSASFCLTKGEKNMQQVWQIHVKNLTNPYKKFDKSM